jgi:hypothetical protein
MKALMDRDSTCAADDIFSHTQQIDLPETWTWEELVEFLWNSSDIPIKNSIGKSTWVLSSMGPIAVAAQEWDRPKLLFSTKMEQRLFHASDEVLHFHWSYIVQTDPDIVYEIISRIKFILA